MQEQQKKKKKTSALRCLRRLDFKGSAVKRLCLGTASTMKESELSSPDPGVTVAQMRAAGHRHDRPSHARAGYATKNETTFRGFFPAKNGHAPLTSAHPEEQANG